MTSTNDQGGPEPGREWSPESEAWFAKQLAKAPPLTDWQREGLRPLLDLSGEPNPYVIPGIGLSGWAERHCRELARPHHFPGQDQIVCGWPLADGGACPNQASHLEAGHDGC
jgi:hypothetical protein